MKMKVSGYQTHQALPYHCDACDVVALLCLHPAKSGGESRITSSLNIYNEMLARRPDVGPELAGIIYRDRRNEIPAGKHPWYELPVLNFHAGYLTVSFGGYIYSAHRFKELPMNVSTLLVPVLCAGTPVRQAPPVSRSLFRGCVGDAIRNNWQAEPARKDVPERSPGTRFILIRRGRTGLLCSMVGIASSCCNSTSPQ